MKSQSSAILDSLLLLSEAGTELRNLLIKSVACSCHPTQEYADYLAFMEEITKGGTPDQRFLLWLKYEFRGQEMEVCDICQAVNAWDDIHTSIDIDNQSEIVTDKQAVGV
jgi:hypothetical protein